MHNAWQLEVNIKALNIICHASCSGSNPKKVQGQLQGKTYEGASDDERAEPQDHVRISEALVSGRKSLAEQVLCSRGIRYR
jgi:hypothetical protein